MEGNKVEKKRLNKDTIKRIAIILLLVLIVINIPGPKKPDDEKKILAVKVEGGYDINTTTLFDDGTVYQNGGDFSKFRYKEYFGRAKKTRRISLLKVNTIKLLINNVVKKEQKNRTNALVYNTNTKQLNTFKIDNSRVFNIDNLFSRDNKSITVEKVMSRTDAIESDRAFVNIKIYDSKGGKHYLDTDSISGKILEIILDRCLEYKYFKD